MLKINYKHISNFKDKYSLINEIDSLYIFYITEYNFLGFDEVLWSNIFNKAIKDELDLTLSYKKNALKIERHINLKIKEYIKKSLNDNRLSFINNMLKYIKHNADSSIMVISLFSKKLEKYDILLSKSNFEYLKHNSKPFQELLNSLDLNNITFDELNIIFKNGELFLLTKDSSLSIKESSELFNYYSSLEDSFLMQNNTFDEYIRKEHFRILKTLIKNHKNITNIYNSLKKIDESIPKIYLDKMLSNLSMSDLLNTLEKKDTMDIYNKVMLRKKSLANRVTNENIYKYFRNLVGITKDEKIELVNIVLAQLTESKLTLIFEYLDNKAIGHSNRGKSAINMLKNLELEYLSLCSKKGFNKRRKETKSLYERFLKIPNKTASEQKEIIDSLFQTLSIENQTKINRYLRGEAHQEEYAEAKKIIQGLKGKYKRMYINSSRVKPLEKRFLDIEGLDKELKILIINELTKELKEEQYKALKKYQDGQKLTDEEKVQVARALANIRSKYPVLSLLILELESTLGIELKNFRSLMNGIGIKKVTYLNKILKLIEYKYQSMGLEKEEYNDFKLFVLKEIMYMNPNFNLEYVILSYLKYTYNDIKSMKR